MPWPSGLSLKCSLSGPWAMVHFAVFSSHIDFVLPVVKNPAAQRWWPADGNKATNHHFCSLLLGVLT